ncbi:SIR2 family protein [Methylobacterium sp. 13MFTsu3.1M2]|uniref:SIR2 family protein n=1 Tax=Methylobacterium sp. 13MFTsu3.1M2 TaxID=1502776 RepID=UPI001AECC9D9|nr:SIR2 family protein [Methylobacterium sp. 13MFTsu3.1M2]
MDSAEPVLLLGAGASITSGIPAAGKTVEKAARWAWCKENGRNPDDFTIRRSDYWPWLTAQPWYKPELSPADLYPDAIDNLLGVKSDRREFFEKLINPPEVPPSRGYVALTQILHQGWISTVLTTNFDQCLERAAIQQNRPHRLVSISTPADYVMFNSAPHDPQLVFLHGSVKHYTDKNLTDEVQSLDPLLVERLRPLLRDHPVIAVGYRGAEASVMNDLFLAQSQSGGFLHGVYWCVLENDLAGPHSAWVEQLADAIGSNFQLVPIRGFDDLFEKDLLASMIAAGARPTRRPSGHSVAGMPADMRPLDGLDVSGFEQPLLRARLRQYADRTDLWRPGDVDAAWVEEMTDRLDLVRPVGGSVAPTLAGWLLFSRNPSMEFPQARVEFHATGPGHWLQSRFGDDVELEPAARDGQFTVRRTITGNLWNQLDGLIELLALVNFQFRLKAEVSRTVNAYNAIAIKEMLVNAIVHRDYDRDEAVRVVVEPKSITVISPGGLIEEIAAQVGEQSFQDAIAERASPIKGYRNPAISDLFYGGGQMDRRGSGLSDMVLATVNNNGSINFGPSADNSRFTVTIEARPEAVDEITNTALPIAEETVRYSSNLIPIETMPAKVWHAATSAGSNRSFYRAAEGLAVPPGHVSDGRFYSFYDLEELAEAMVTPFDPGEIEALDFDELIALPSGESIALKLLHDLLFEHLKTKGLQIEYDRRRAYFARGDEPELKVSYQGRLRKATRTVVKARTKRESDDIVYYEHKAVSFSVMRFGGDWAVVLTPGYAFTRDGMRKPISRERTNALSTRRAARDFNPSVLQDVSFWLAILSGEAEGLFAIEHRSDNDLARFAPSVLLSHRTPTISFNVSAFDEFAQRETEIDEDLQQLDAELEALALEPDDEDGKGVGRNRENAGEGEPEDAD